MTRTHQYVTLLNQLFPALYVEQEEGMFDAVLQRCEDRLKPSAERVEGFELLHREYFTDANRPKFYIV